MTHKQKTPTEIFNELKNTYKDFAKTKVSFKSDGLNKEFEEILDDAIYTEPYIEHIAKYKFTGNSLEKDIKEDLKDNDLYEFLSYKDSLFPQDKNYCLYKHQKQSLELSNNNKHVIVTSGTGSGKTETFLLPVLQNILKDSEKWDYRGEYPETPWKQIDEKSRTMYYQRDGETRPAAIRALIMYPLNALVEDQLIRLRKTLDSDEARKFLKENRRNNLIYFGRYNSSTPISGKFDSKDQFERFKEEINQIEEDQNAKYHNGVFDVEINDFKYEPKGKYFTPRLDGAEMYSRWDMQKYPPDILISNYSMLNIMLMRNIESEMFEKTKEWLNQNPKHKFQLVLDELHSYRGTAGTEIAYLLRQFLNRIGLSPDSEQLQILASSASLGEDVSESKKFLCEFFGCKDQNRFEIITGEIEKPEDEENQEKRELLDLFYDKKENKYKAFSINDLTQKSGYSTEELEDKIRKTELKIRVHYFFKNFRGLWACSNPNCSEVKDNHKDEHRRIGKLYTAPKSICKCGSRILEVLTCHNCGEVFLGGYFNPKSNREDDEIYLFPECSDLETLPDMCNTNKEFSNYKVLKYDDIDFENEENSYTENKIKRSWDKSYFDYSRGILFSSIYKNNNSQICYSYELKGKKIKPKENILPARCPYCESDWSNRKNPKETISIIRPVIFGFQKVNQILADKLLDIQKNKNLVVFTDSRQDAAKISAGIEMDHYRVNLKQALFKVLNEHNIENSNIKILCNLYKQKYENHIDNSDKIKKTREKIKKAKDIANYFKDIYINEDPEDKNLDEDDTNRVKNRIDLANIGLCKLDNIRGDIFEDLLKLGINPGGYKNNIFNKKCWTDLYSWENGKYQGELSSTDANRFQRYIWNEYDKELFKALFSSKRGIETLGVGIVTYDRTKYDLTKTEQETVDAIIRFLGEKSKYEYSGKKTEKDLKFIESYLKNVDINPENILNLLLKTQIIKSKEQIELNPSALCIIQNQDKNQVYYKCPKCGKIYLNSSNGYCINKRCKNTKLELGKNIDSDIYNKYYYKLMQQEPSRLISEELTAQTDKNDQKIRQRKFQNIYKYSGNSNIQECKIKDEINILSVTTTMEAGVDIGALESVMMSNMPPERFNYQQRVGRAGRRDNPLAIALTVCRNRSHDAFYFQHPEKITNDPTLPPYLDMRSERILERFCNKEILRQALEQKEQEKGESVHGEFGSVASWNEYSKKDLTNWIKNNDDKINNILDILLKQTSLIHKKEELFFNIKNNLVNEIDESVSKYKNEFDRLSELLANAGLLPMFGYPTKTRNLLIDNNIAHKDLVNRDLDIAISQFAPKAETVRDKKIHISVGIKSSALDDGKVKKYSVCTNCKNIKEITNLDILETENCENCGEECKIVSTVQPEEFYTITALNEYYTPIIYDGNFEYTPYSQKPQINQTDNINLEHSSDVNANYKYLKDTELVEVVSINDNLGDNYKLKQYEIESQKNKKLCWISEDAINVYKEKKSENSKVSLNKPTELEPKDIALVSSKKTDVFLLEIDKIPAGINLQLSKQNLYSKSAYYSAAFLIRDAAAKCLDIDKKEIIVGLRPVANNGKPVTAQMFLSDALENGAGYSKWLCDENNLKKVFDEIENSIKTTFLNPKHSDNCDSSCYYCMQDYSNLHFHGLLDWRLALDMIEIMKNKNFEPNLEIDYWKRLTQKAKINVDLWADKLNVDKNKIKLIHPLQNLNNNANSEIVTVNIFDLLKRPEEAINQLKTKKK